MKNEKIAQIIYLHSFKKLPLKNKKIVLMGGAFDIIHPGHIEHFSKAKKMGDILVVHITGDKRFFEKKKRKPIFSERERAKIVSSIKGVDYVFAYNGRHYDQKIINIINPSVLFFNIEAYQDKARDYVKKKLSYNGKIFISKLKKINSSSKIIKQINKIY